jgi:hypothetical protein
MSSARQFRFPKPPPRRSGPGRTVAADAARGGEAARPFIGRDAITCGRVRCGHTKKREELESSNKTRKLERLLQQGARAHLQAAFLSQR